MPGGISAKKRSQELREIWLRLMIDPEVAQRAQDLADQGRWEEQGTLIAEYVRSHQGLMEEARRANEAYERGECISFKEYLKRKASGRKRI